MPKPSFYREQITKMLNAGKTPRIIRQKFPDVSPTAISLLRKKLGLPPFKKGIPKDMVSRRYAVEFRKAGWAYQKIGDALGVSRQRVHQLLVEAGKAGRLPKAARPPK